MVPKASPVCESQHDTPSVCVCGFNALLSFEIKARMSLSDEVGRGTARCKIMSLQLHLFYTLRLTDLARKRFTSAASDVTSGAHHTRHCLRFLHGTKNRANCSTSHELTAAAIQKSWARARPALLKGSWGLVTRVIIRVTILITSAKVLITLLTKSHDPAN